MKGASGWAFLTALLLLASPAAAGRLALDADLDHRLDGSMDGVVAVHDGAAIVLGAASGPGKADPAFALRGALIEAMIVRSYSTRDEALGAVLPLLDLTTTVQERDDDAIAGNNIEVEERTFTAPQLRLLAATGLWHVSVFDHPDLAAPAEFSLPSGAYTLGHAPDWARLTRPEVPQPGEVRTVTDAVQETLPGLLQVGATGLAAHASGDFYALLYGGTFEVATVEALEEIVTGQYEEDYTDAQGLPSRRTVNATVLLRVTQGVLDAANPGPGLLYAPELHLKGRLDLHAAQGVLDQGDGPLALTDSERSFDGDLRLATRGARYTADDGTLRGPIAITGWTYAPATVGLTPWLVGAAALGAAALGVRYVPALRRFAFGALALFSMAGRPDVLENPTRSQILDLVRERPGTSLSSVQRGLGLGWGTMSYHVTLLERTGLLVTKRAGGKRLLFAQGDSRLMEPAAWGLLQNPSVRRLAETLLAAPEGVTQADLSRRLDCSTQYVGRLLRKLEVQQLVASDALNGRLHAYRAGPRLVELAPRLQASQTAPADAAAVAALAPLAQ